MPETENMTDQELLHDAVRSTEQEIQDAAWQDEPAGDEPAGDDQDGEQDQQQEQPAADAGDKGQPRNERGQFASREQSKAGADQQQEQPADGEQEQRAGDDADGVPRWRLREIAEERRQAQAERDALRVELTKLQTQIAQRPAQQQQEQEIDPLLDPVGWQKKIEAGFEEKIRTMALDMDLRVAHIRHGETFEKAYTALLEQGQRGNGQLVRQLVGNPQGAGDRIVSWFKNQELMRETKGDLNGFKKQIREELLKDPEFLKQAMEAARGQASGGQQPGQQQGQRPNNITRLPPSLARQAGGSPNSDPIDTDDSEKAVFDYAFR